MVGQWVKRMRKYRLAFWAAILFSSGVSRAGENEAELRTLIEQQSKQIQELKQRLDAVTAPAGNGSGIDPAKPNLDDSAVKKIVSEYLKENPGAGMPPSVQTGYSPTPAGGFFIRSAPDPSYVKWDDDCKIPFELRIRGRVQLDYYNYKITDRLNHVTDRYATANANETALANFSQLEVKRSRIILAGTAFDPNLRYWLEIDGNTRGLGGLQNNRVVQTAPGNGFAPNTSPTSPIGGGVTTDHAVRLFSAYVAYDFHGCESEKGCGADCPEGSYKYAPTYTIIVGKAKPYFAFEEYLGSGNEQFVEYGMSEWMFDAENDNLLMLAGTQIKALEDRLFAMAVITNGADNQFANSQMTNYPGFNAGFWYDFGGSWNNDTKRWNLYGDTVSDIDYSCNPVVRVGAMTYMVPMNRRSLYGDAEASFYFTTPAGPGGTRLINILTGDATTPNGAHAVDDFDAYTVETFVAGKYRGFSFLNDWFFRSLNHFRTTPNGQGNIVYQDSTGANALFPANHALFDYGFLLQAGYFIVPKRLELAARWCFISGDSGDINGNGRFVNRNIPGVMNPVRVIGDAFHNFHEADEFAVGVNYYFKRQLLKWQTDFSVYKGGNPAGGGVSAAGFIAGSDGWMLRTQVQLAF
jgi:hypothetical protein